MSSKLVLLLLTLLSLFDFTSASHFRFGSVTWTSAVGSNTVVFQVTIGLRRTAYSPLPLVGVPVNVGIPLFFGDGGSQTLIPTPISVDVTNDWFLATQTITRTYANNLARTAYVTTCCRISTLHDGNQDKNFNYQTIVYPGSGIISPSSSLPPIINVLPPALGIPFTFTIPVATSQGEDIQFSISPASISSLVLVQPAGLTINSNTGLVSWLVPAGKPLGYYAIQIKLDAYKGPTLQTYIVLDFILNLMAPSNFHPPQFVAPTPLAGAVLNAAIGVTLNIPIAANDIDASVVTILNAGLPLHAVWTSTAGVNAVANIAFTPQAAQAGQIYVISLTAREPHGLEVYRSFSIVVAIHPPQFNHPTPANNAIITVTVGNTVTVNIAASNPLDNSVVRITNGGLPVGSVWSNVDGLSATATIVFTASVVGDFVVKLIAREPHNLQATTTFTFHCIPGGVVGDPQFMGFIGQSFQVHGISNMVYNVLSTPSIQYNALFRYLDSGKCRKGTACFAHPGNYFGEVGVTFSASTGPVSMFVESGPVDTGLTVSINGTVMAVGDSATAGIYTISIPNAFEAVIDSEEFSIRIQNSDLFLNQDVSIGSGLMKQISAYKSVAKSGDVAAAEELLAKLPHGILGQTWNAKTYSNRWKHIEGQLFDYQVNDGIMGTDFKFNRF